MCCVYVSWKFIEKETAVLHDLRRVRPIRVIDLILFLLFSVLANSNLRFKTLHDRLKMSNINLCLKVLKYFYERS